ncbi:hypothetical protein O3G_MSEX013669 [Manduca sexta]|uniref:Peptidase S1 domain-containing protein n=1 Tax=Manduca sexta TaxID=7130 RepID=A0A921ZTH8_MANSE|nr:hypothetical protein O3G_MSEX013669 [Manduca sexta]
MIVLYTLLATVTSYRFLPQESLQVSLTTDALRKYISSSAESPYHVLIVYSSLYCSGALVRSKVVVTVASCMTVKEPKNAVVKIGSDTIVGYGQIIPVVEVKIHEYFKHLSSMDNDIAVLCLKHDVNLLPTAKKVIIVESEVALRIGTTLQVTGWGGPKMPGKFANVLLRSEMVVLNKSHCQKHYKHLLTSSNFCVKYQPERRLGDNGGPAVLNELLVGLVSFGATNIKEPHVAVLTNVSYFHRWILLNSSRLLKKYCIPKHDKDEKEIQDIHHQQDVA